MVEIYFLIAKFFFLKKHNIIIYLLAATKLMTKELKKWVKVSRNYTILPL
jgi:hypothetical protein